MNIDILFSLIEFFGIISFSISGALTGIRRNIDFLGVIICSITTVIGGGMIRDLLLGRTPPVALVDPYMVTLAIVVGFFTFSYSKHVLNIDKNAHLYKVYEWADTLGVGTFIVGGVNAAVSAGYIDNIFLMTFSGILTAVGGGLLRDTMLSKIPAVLRSKDLVATTAIICSIHYSILVKAETYAPMSIILTVALSALLRVASINFNLHMPQAEIAPKASDDNTRDD